MAVHRPVWNASPIPMWEWEGGGFSGLCVSCGLRARTPLLEGWPASPSDSPLACFVSSSVTISFIQVRAGSWLWTPVFPVCLPSLHTHKCTVRQMPCCHLSGLKNVAVSEQVSAYLNQKDDSKISGVLLLLRMLLHTLETTPTVFKN